MRILVRLLPLSEPAALPLDNYPLAALVYRSVWMVAPNFAEFLHEEGWQDEGGEKERQTRGGQAAHKRFRFFVFSRLEQPDKRIVGGRQWLSPHPVEWQIASPFAEMMEMLAEGLIRQEVVSLGDEAGTAQLAVAEIIELPDPPINGQMRFQTLSPLFVAVDEVRPDGRHRKHHLRADDHRYGERVAANLVSRYRALTGGEPANPQLEFRFLGPPKAQLVQYKGTHHHCYLGRFEVSGSRELIRLGWDGGFGEANSKGFGMVACLER